VFEVMVWIRRSPQRIRGLVYISFVQGVMQQFMVLQHLEIEIDITLKLVNREIHWEPQHGCGKDGQG
jgi:hypothetical protein